MKQTVALICLVLAGCGGATPAEVTMSEEERRAFCSGNYDATGDPYSVVETDDWRLGDLPLWSTPEVVRNRFGAPDTTFQELPWTDVLGVSRFVVGRDTLSFGTVRDTLAFPYGFPLRLGALSTGRVTLGAGASSAEVEAAFPLSYRCRNWPLGANLAYLPYDTEVFVDDTTNGGRVALWLRNDSLIAVGVDSHFGSMDERVRPRRSDSGTHNPPLQADPRHQRFRSGRASAYPALRAARQPSA